MRPRFIDFGVMLLVLCVHVARTPVRQRQPSRQWGRWTLHMVFVIIAVQFHGLRGSEHERGRRFSPEGYQRRFLS
jgi:hypothetical protein